MKMKVYEFDCDPGYGFWLIATVRSLREWNRVVKKSANPHTILALEGKGRMMRVAYQYTKNRNGRISHHTIEKPFSLSYMMP